MIECFADALHAYSTTVCKTKKIQGTAIMTIKIDTQNRLAAMRMNYESIHNELKVYLYNQPNDFSLEQAVQIKNQHIPKRLFKYFSFTKENLVAFYNNVLYCPSPDRLDDLYDEFMLPDKHALLQEAIENIIETGLVDTDIRSVLHAHKTEILNSADPIVYFANLFSQNQKMTVRKLQGTMDILINEIKRMAYKGIRICCFSQTIDAEAIWSKHADKERGFALSYVIDDENICNNLWPVLYNENDLLRQYASVMSNDINMVKILISIVSKSMEWQHEQEWRLIVNENYLYNERYIPMKADAIYLGAKIDKENKKEIMSIVQHKGIEAFMMRPSNQLPSYHN